MEYKALVIISAGIYKINKNYAQVSQQNHLACLFSQNSQIYLKIQQQRRQYKQTTHWEFNGYSFHLEKIPIYLLTSTA